MTAMQRRNPFLKSQSGYLSTHPPTLDRILKAQEAAAQFRGAGEGRTGRNKQDEP
jgi:predicted Zn-dependent protease